MMRLLWGEDLIVPQSEEDTTEDEDDPSKFDVPIASPHIEEEIDPLRAAEDEVGAAEEEAQERGAVEEEVDERVEVETASSSLTGAD